MFQASRKSVSYFTLWQLLIRSLQIFGWFLVPGKTYELFTSSKEGRGVMAGAADDGTAAGEAVVSMEGEGIAGDQASSEQRRNKKNKKRRKILLEAHQAVPNAGAGGADAGGATRKTALQQSGRRGLQHQRPRHGSAKQYLRVAGGGESDSQAGGVKACLVQGK